MNSSDLITLLSLTNRIVPDHNRIMTGNCSRGVDSEQADRKMHGTAGN